MDREAWCAGVHRATELDTTEWLNWTEIKKERKIQNTEQARQKDQNKTMVVTISKNGQTAPLTRRGIIRPDF